MKNIAPKKNVFITGSSRGIGFYLAKKFFLTGNFNVILNSRNGVDLKKAIKDIGNSKHLHGIVGDVSNTYVSKKILKKAIDRYGELDIVICNVGKSSSEQEPGFETFNEWHNLFNANFYSAVNIIQSSFETLSLTKGNVVCISSICGKDYISGAPLPYATSKAALNHYVKYISKVYGKFGIRINCVSPGNIFFEGSVWQKKISKRPSIKELTLNSIPLERFGDLDDVSNLVYWLTSNDAKFVTGSNFVIDGGQTSTI